MPSDLAPTRGAAGRPRHRARLRWRDEEGSTLLLMPVAVLIVLGLAAVAVDSALLFLGQRRVADLAASVAVDAAAAIDEDAFYADDLRLDPHRAERRRDMLVAAESRTDALREPSCDVQVDGTRAEAACRAEVRLIFRPAVPGLADVQEVRARDAAVARTGPSG